MRAEPQPLLELWERAIGRRGGARDEALLGFKPGSLTERNHAALERYAALFGTSAELLGRCPHCGESVEFDIDAAACAAQLPPEIAINWHDVEVDGEHVRFRSPVPADLHALADIDDEHAFAEALLARCVQGELPSGALVRDAVSRRLETVSPGAVVHFALSCPQCAGQWNAPLDPMEMLWRELRGRAESLLAEVAILARAWGWNEHEILRLSPIRRAAYLQLASA